MPRIRRRTLLFLTPLALIAAFGIARMLFRPPVRYTIRGVGMDIPSGSAALDINNQGVIVGLEMPPPDRFRKLFQQKRFLFVDRNGTTERLPLPLHEYQGAFTNDRGDILAPWLEWSSGPPMSARSLLWRDGKTIVLNWHGAHIAGRGLAPDGSVSGEMEALSPHAKPVIWKDGHTTALPSPPGIFPGVAYGINGLGETVGWVGNVTPVLWRGGKPQELPKPAKADRLTNPFAVNDRDQIVGIYTVTSWTTAHPGTLSFRACLWENGTVRDLGTLWGDSWASDVNNRGEIIGRSDMRGALRFHWQAWRTPRRMLEFRGTSRAVLYKDGNVVDLNRLIPRGSGWVLDAAAAINDNGQIVGEGTYRGKPRGFVLTPVGPVQPAG